MAAIPDEGKRRAVEAIHTQPKKIVTRLSNASQQTVE